MGSPDLEPVEGATVDPLLILLIVVVVALSGCGYGTYSTRPIPVQTEVVTAPG
jgi:hypothetical protein